MALVPDFRTAESVMYEWSGYSDNPAHMISALFEDSNDVDYMLDEVDSLENAIRSMRNDDDDNILRQAFNKMDNAASKLNTLITSLYHNQADKQDVLDQVDSMKRMADDIIESLPSEDDDYDDFDGDNDEDDYEDVDDDYDAGDEEDDYHKY